MQCTVSARRWRTSDTITAQPSERCGVTCRPALPGGLLRSVRAPHRLHPPTSPLLTPSPTSGRPAPHGGFARGLPPPPACLSPRALRTRRPLGPLRRLCAHRPGSHSLGSDSGQVRLADAGPGSPKRPGRKWPPRTSAAASSSPPIGCPAPAAALAAQRTLCSGSRVGLGPEVGGSAGWARCNRKLLKKGEGAEKE